MISKSWDEKSKALLCGGIDPNMQKRGLPPAPPTHTQNKNKKTN